jgi:hypothetical protein
MPGEWMDAGVGEWMDGWMERLVNYIGIMTGTCQGRHVIMDGNACSQRQGRCCSSNMQGTNGTPARQMFGKLMCAFCFFGGPN